MTRERTLDVVGLLARLVLGGALLVAGGLKVGNPAGSARAVQAYDVLPFDVARYVGYALPYIEVIVGGLLVLGLFTWAMAAVGTALMVVFVIGIAQAWARGLSIDCGCFGGGGQVAPEETKYGREIVRDLAFALCGAWLLWRPRSLASLDRVLLGR
ncbi:DoxX family membrane protein [Janibacter sp. YIM B02568]|uniref:DoxX family protein n=1 Tax=Janibacter endophyticus TaxID=2806261 RepID=UPI0019529921|nr:MauE/DoxX family redox-associated membrane protein [Janibacter endophyticus]MBM6546505.1 DoxX family membrane protein [Janibacter endophyticus]